MQRTRNQRPAAATPPPSDAHPTTFRDVLAGLAGHVVTVVNPQSLEEAPVGRRLTPGFYRAKVLELEGDYLVLATEFIHRSGTHKEKEPAKQFLPVERIKRLSLLTHERLVHL